MTFRLNTLSFCLATTAGIAVIAAPALAREYVYSSWFGVNHTTNQIAIEPYLDAVSEQTSDEVTWKFVPGAQLASGPGTPEAVGDGLIDAGIAIAPYQPRLLPATNTIFSNSLLGNDTLAAGAAMNETVLMGCPQCQEEYHALNAVGFAGYATTPYVFMCSTMIEDVGDLAGLKVRASGGGVSITEIAGATPVSMSPTEATTSLERGTLDCVLGAVGWLKSYGYMDVVESVVESPMGMGGPPLLMFVNKDSWEDMSPEDRQVHIDFAPELIAAAVYDGQVLQDEKTFELAKEAGVAFTPDNEGFAGIMTQHDSVQRDRVIEEAEKAGVEGAGELLESYMATYDKWVKLLDEKGRDRDTYRQLLWDEIYSKVDPEAL